MSDPAAAVGRRFFYDAVVDGVNCSVAARSRHTGICEREGTDIIRRRRDSLGDLMIEVEQLLNATAQLPTEITRLGFSGLDFRGTGAIGCE